MGLFSDAFELTQQLQVQDLCAQAFGLLGLAPLQSFCVFVSKFVGGLQ